MYRTGARVLFATWVGAIASLAAAQKPMQVSIDIKPGDTVTTLEADRGGMLPIALLSTAQFDAALADPATIRVGPSGSEAEPGLVGVAPGSGLIKCPPVSVCHQVSTIGQRQPPTVS